MLVPFVDLKAQYASIKPEIDTVIQRVFDETSFVGGKYVADFEKDFSIRYQAKHVIGVANGTDAIYIVLKMLGIGPGDEVITSASSWISTSETISQTGARPIFVDIDPQTYTINPELIEGKITPRTRAIIPVHLYGQMAHVSTIKEICDKHELFLVEDCAQSHFSMESNVLAGKTGIAGTFSFYPGKNLGAYGDAGCIITNDDHLASRCRMYANHGSLKKHDHQMEGINSRLDTLQAAVLSVKLKYIDQWTQSRINNATLYSEHFRNCTEVQVPQVRRDTLHSFHLYVIRTPVRDKLKLFLEEHGIQTAIHYPVALPFLPAYNHLGHTKADFPVAFRLQNEILSLPMYPELSVPQIEYVSAQIANFFRK